MEIEPSLMPAPSCVQASPMSSAATVSYRVLVSVQEGLHRGAAFISASSESVYLGSSADCDLVLVDAGVQEKAMRLYEYDGLLVADVLSTGVKAGGIELPMGTKTFDEPIARIQVGDAELRVELLRRRERMPAVDAGSERALIQPVAAHRRNWTALSLAGLSCVVALAVLGSAVYASVRRDARQEAPPLSSIIEFFNALGGQMVLSGESEGIPRVRGLVLDASMKERLLRDIRASGAKVDVQVNDVRQMGESLVRLALLADQPCEVRHLGGGRFECNAGVASQDAVSRLNALAQQVPGMVELRVLARQPENAPATNSEPVTPLVHVGAAKEPAAERPKMPAIRHVAIGQKESFAYDSQGRKLRVNDVVNGAKVVRIRFEGVDFLRDKQRFTVGITPVLVSASSNASD